MKFVINTSFDPHFCVLYSPENQIVATTNWAIPKQDGRQVWDFLRAHLTPETPLEFIGGVSGPGSFSSLRAGGAILNALAFKFNLPIFQARADTVIQEFLNTTTEAHTPFLLNSFGSRVFVCDDGNITPYDIESNTVDKNIRSVTAWLPPHKAERFKEPVAVNALGPVETLLGTLEKTTGQKQFIPDYEYPAVQA